MLFVCTFIHIRFISTDDVPKFKTCHAVRQIEILTENTPRDIVIKCAEQLPLIKRLYCISKLGAEQWRYCATITVRGWLNDMLQSKQETGLYCAYGFRRLIFDLETFFESSPQDCEVEGMWEKFQDSMWYGYSGRNHYCESASLTFVCY